MTPHTAPRTAPDAALDAPPTLLQRAHLPFAIGAVALVTLGAFENRAVLTVLPTVADHLDGLWLFGAAAAAPLISFVVATTVAGSWSDHRGPVPVLYAGMGLFVAGELLMGLAPAMVVFVAGRLVGGLAEGLLDVGLTVLVARALPARLRPKIFATFAAAWVLPSLLGPPVAAWVTTTWSWRWVFWLVVVPVVAALALVFARRAQIAAADEGIDESSRDHREHARAAWFGVLIAASAGALQWGTHDLELTWSAKTAAAVLGVLGIAATAPMLLPRGTWLLRRGLPSVMLARFLLTCSFFGTITYIPLMLVNERGQSLGTAGTILAVGSLGWSTGSSSLVACC